MDDPPLLRRLPDGYDPSGDDLLERFLDYATEKKLELYPAQEEAILELFGGKNVILNTPTGSGKSLVATALHFKALAEGRRSIYTCPIKALVNEKFFALCKEFGPENVGMMTGDAAVNRDALILCCTAEILSNVALREGKDAKVDYVIMDEFHYYADRERGVAWQVPLLTMPQVTFLLMSATLGPTEVFEQAITDITGRETVVVRSTQRPVPLDYVYGEIALHEQVQKLLQKGQAPVYLVCFTQRACAEEAQNLMSVDWCTKEEKKALAEAMVGEKFSSPYGKEIQKFLRHGIGLHHAGLLPRYRLLVEKLAQQGMLKIICGTDTLGVGVNIPIRTVLFTKLCKFDGQNTTILSVRDFQQISGRAGRKGFDTQGTVVVQAPEHVIENLKLEQKAIGDPKKLKKLVRRKPPEKGYLPWNKETFDRLVTSQPEPLVSRFQVSHGMLLNVLSRPNNEGCRAMKTILRTSHERPVIRRQQGKLALQMFRSLLEAKIVEVVPNLDGPGKTLRIGIDLQKDFSLNQALSMFLVDVVSRLDPAAPEYALDLLSMVESILENPDLILRKQLDRIKTEKMAEMKANGIEYDERIATLDTLDYPKPNAETIYAAFNEFAKNHPWMAKEAIRPKSVAREMYETFASFSDYIKDYELQRTEGLLLRYLTDVYKTLSQTIPDILKNDEVFAIELFLGTMVRSVDSSLLDEWERMKRQGHVPTDIPKDEAPPPPPDITRDRKGFRVLVRNDVFRLLRTIANRDWEAAAQICEPTDPPWTADRFEAVAKPFFADHPGIRLDPAARAPNNTSYEETDDGQFWTVRQIIVPRESRFVAPIAAVQGDEHHEDPDADADVANEWVLEVQIDITRSRDEGRVVMGMVDLHA